MDTLEVIKIEDKRVIFKSLETGEICSRMIPNHELELGDKVEGEIITINIDQTNDYNDLPESMDIGNNGLDHY